MRSVLSDVERFRQDPEADRLFAQEQTLLRLTELVCREMERRNVDRAELARRMGRREGEVTAMLAGGRELTLRSLSDMLFALGLCLEPRAVELRTV